VGSIDNKEPAMPATTATTEAVPFVWDRDYRNNEQVRPYFAAYSEVRARVAPEGLDPYDSLFIGEIPGIAGSADEATGIYLLQTMHRLDALAVEIAAFTETGGKPISEFDLDGKVLRGTLVHHGFYMGGTGWEVTKNVRVTFADNPGIPVERQSVLFKKPGQRNWRHQMGSQAQYLFLPAGSS
jgi:hypothetical protein